MNSVRFRDFIFLLCLVIFYGCSSKNSNYDIVKKNNKYGVNDVNGNLIIKYSYDMIYPFDSNGFAVVNNFGGKFGVIDTNNKIILDIIYDYIDNFENGKAQIKINGKIGYVNQFYEIIQKPQ